MEHTYIELEFGIHLKDLSEYDCKKVIDIVARLLFDKEKKTRTETLMECRGLVEGEIWKSHELNEEFEKKFSTEQVQEINELCLKSHNNGMDDLCTAIDNLIKK